MPRITYVDDNDVVRVLEVPPGYSLMEGATKHSVSGIPADCGGSAACATCQVDIDEAWREQMPARQPIEASMLEDEEGDRPSRRLSCQITVTEAMDGLIVRVPAVRR